MKMILGVLVILAGVIAGIYVGVWVMFIGGIVMIVDAIKANPVDGVDIGLGLLRVCFSAVAGWLTVIFTVTVGAAIAASSD